MNIVSGRDSNLHGVGVVNRHGRGVAFVMKHYMGDTEYVTTRVSRSHGVDHAQVMYIHT